MSSKLWQPFSGWWFPIFWEGFTPLIWGKDETQSWRYHMFQMGWSSTTNYRLIMEKNNPWILPTVSWPDPGSTCRHILGTTAKRPGWYSQGDVYLDCQWRQSYSLGLPGAARDRWRIFNPNSLVSRRQLVTFFICLNPMAHRIHVCFFGIFIYRFTTHFNSSLNSLHQNPWLVFV